MVGSGPFGSSTTATNSISVATSISWERRQQVLDYCVTAICVLGECAESPGHKAYTGVAVPAEQDTV
jgi:hypothetical protein